MSMKDLFDSLSLWRSGDDEFPDGYNPVSRDEAREVLSVSLLYLSIAAIEFMRANRHLAATNKDDIRRQIYVSSDYINTEMNMHFLMYPHSEDGLTEAQIRAPLFSLILLYESLVELTVKEWDGEFTSDLVSKIFNEVKSMAVISSSATYMIDHSEISRVLATRTIERELDEAIINVRHVINDNNIYASTDCYMTNHKQISYQGIGMVPAIYRYGEKNNRKLRKN